MLPRFKIHGMLSLDLSKQINKGGGMILNYREYLINALLNRLGRCARSSWAQRRFLVERLTEALCMNGNR